MTLPTTETVRSTDDEIIDSISTSYDFGWHDSDEAGEKAKRGLDEQVVREISAIKGEPEWMLAKRLKAYSTFERKPMPTWGVDLSQLDMDAVKYYVRSTDRPANSWDDLPEDIKNTYDRIGIPEAERERLVAGVAAQYESEVVYHQIRGDLEEQGVIFVDTDTAVREYPELVQEYFGTVVPAGDNKFAALNTAVWSGGSFIYVPKGVHVEIPLQAYFRINTENMGQFERTLIIADEDSYVHYVEGCTAPIYSTDSLHSAIVEIVVKKNARVRYTTIQNWSNNVYNLVTQRATCEEGATMEWVDGNIGSKRHMKYPAVFLMGPTPAARPCPSPSPARTSTRTPAPRWSTWRPTPPATSSPSRSPARRPQRLPRSGADHEERPPLQVQRAVRRAPGRRDLPVGHLPLRRRAYRRRRDGPRGHRLQGERRSALLPHAARPDRDRGHGHDRARLRRAHRPRAAHGVRPRAQPAHRAADGELGGLRPPHRTVSASTVSYSKHT
ncbi:putative FeS assembly protein SufB [Actinomyces naeslundii str. Howell 279]|uniref:Putative FeS assembly protein SufB n=1 Tax=Actinomyces naeslundii (strain ATCC 12104 / DSM 43013 / CCUG 2238 / JCM 8349 / NCTC 10301 / Howell 279) TaxID=1115803 RepID=J2ZTI1_ACTNH|nr:putative FeS assembly protein SufB [Actinomyces naeslundii str. Howell 279]